MSHEIAPKIQPLRKWNVANETEIVVFFTSSLLWVYLCAKVVASSSSSSSSTSINDVVDLSLCIRWLLNSNVMCNMRKPPNDGESEREGDAFNHMQTFHSSQPEIRRKSHATQSTFAMTQINNPTHSCTHSASHTQALIPDMNMSR